MLEDVSWDEFDRLARQESNDAIKILKNKSNITFFRILFLWYLNVTKLHRADGHPKSGIIRTDAGLYQLAYRQ